MKLGLFISAVLHAALLGWVVISIANTPAKEAEPVKRINVDILQTAEVTKIREGVRKPKKPEKTEKPAPPVKKVKPKVKQAIKKVAVLPPAPKPQPKAEKKPEPKRIEKKPEPEKKKVEKPKPAPKPVVKKPAPKKAVEKPKPRKVVKPKPKPQPKPKKVAKTQPKPAPKRKPDPKFDPNNIAALLNRLPNAPVEPQPRVERFARRNESPVAPSQQLGQRDGRDQQLSVTERDRLLGSLTRQIEGCWSPPTGVREARNLVPRMRFSLRRDGSLLGQPEVLNGQGSELFLAAQTAAMRAIYECQPYRLPPELYSAWRDVILSFDPKEMLGG